MTTYFRDVLPPGLVSTVQKLAYFKSERRKIIPDNISAGPSQPVSVRLPNTGLIDLSSLSWHAKLNIATQPAFVPPLGCFISRLKVLADGQVVDNIDNYSLLFFNMLNHTCSDAHARTRYSAGCLQAKPTFVIANVEYNINNSDNTLETAEIVSAGSATATRGVVTQRTQPKYLGTGVTWATECDFLGFLGSIPYIMADQWPNMRIEFQLETNSILGNTPSGSGTWTIDDNYFVVDVINYSRALADFNNMFALAQTGEPMPISYAMDRWVCQRINNSASTVNNINFNIGSSNLRKILYTYRANGFNTQATLAYADNPCSNYFVFTAQDGAADMTESALYISGRQYNQFPINLTYDAGSACDDTHGYLDLLKTLGFESDNQFDSQVNSFNQYRKNRFLHAYAFDWRQSGGDANVISGENTIGQSDCQLVIKSDAALTAGGEWFIMAHCTSMLHIYPGRRLEIEN